MEKVRYEEMLPHEIVERRRKFPAAFIGLGCLEWHGSHMPFGTDYLTVTYIAEEAAKRFGGVVFPPVYYGDVRYILQECRVEWRKTYTREMVQFRGYLHPSLPPNLANHSPDTESLYEPLFLKKASRLPAIRILTGRTISAAHQR